jgi:hypothetical protein
MPNLEFVVFAASDDQRGFPLAVQVISAVSTLFGVLAALWIAQRGWKKQEEARLEQRASEEREQLRRQEAEDAQAQAQARLVLVNNMGVHAPDPDTGQAKFIHTLRMINHSEHPVLDILAEVWAPPDARDGRHSGGSSLQVLLPGKEQLFPCGVHHDTQSLTAWQITWTDHHGRQWRSDANKEPGRPFDGTPPRQYPAPCDISTAST